MKQLTDRGLLGHISRLPHSRASFKQLVREFGGRDRIRTCLRDAFRNTPNRAE